MLILSRRLSEQVVFPQLGIRVQVARINRSVVRLGIRAPQGIKIMRGEVPTFESSVDSFEQAIDENTTASESVATAMRMALQLTSNQVNAGLTDHALASLEEALRLLDRLEELVPTAEIANPTVSSTVRESRSAYGVDRNGAWSDGNQDHSMRFETPPYQDAWSDNVSTVEV